MLTIKQPPPASFKAALQDSKTALVDSTDERDRRQEQLAALELRIIQLRRTIVSLSALCGEATDIESMGITDSTRFVMNAATGPMTVKAVKNALALHGFDLSTQKNADASVTAVLNRLAEAKEIRKLDVTVAGKVTTGYVGPKYK